jgi:extradiol dioxygenase family protein
MGAKATKMADANVTNSANCERFGVENLPEKTDSVIFQYYVHQIVYVFHHVASCHPVMKPWEPWASQLHPGSHLENRMDPLVMSK